MKQCVLHPEKICNDCGECDDRCELDPQKICDNCFRCLESDTRTYAEIPVSGVYFDDDFSPEADRPQPIDFEDGFVLDSNDAWKEEGAFTSIRTLPGTFGTRLKRRS
ncbi:MAG: hypothetical protein LLF75_08820 [Eubacteriales bacterium]|nr:hypothetical protein [Eubacteriales bacterium]